MTKPITLNDIDDIIQAIDNVVRTWETWSPQIIEEFCSDFQFALLKHLEKMEREGKVNQVLNSWDGEIEDEEDDNYEE